MKHFVRSLIALTFLAVSPALADDLARYILPPGNFGGLPFTVNSTDQLVLYSGLTPLRDNITMADIDQFFLPEDFQPIEPSREEVTGRPGLRIVYDAWGIPHIYGETRDDVSFGAGWVTGRDRALLLQVGRGPARVAVADVPNIDAFSLVTGLQSFVPSAAAEALVTEQVALIRETYGKYGEEIIADCQAYADGINAYWAANNINQPKITVNDVVAVTAFIGSIFGAGGGGEAANSDLLAKLQQQLGADRGYKAWVDVMLADDPEAPTTITRRFEYGPLTGGEVTGSVVVDPDSIQSIDPRQRAVLAAAAPTRQRASNFLVTARHRSKSFNSLAVMGPQLGYYYPEIVQQIDLHGPDFTAQGAAVPGLAMYILIGRTPDYAWSLTSAGHDVRDVFAEKLCEPTGSPTRASTNYLFDGQCRAMTSFTAGTLNGTPLTYNLTVHGPVFATATVGGQPYALSRRRSTFGKDGLNLAALKGMTEGDAKTPGRFWKVANRFGFTFNWAYVSRRATAYFTSGLLPIRARGLDRRLPTLGTGEYEWKPRFLRKGQHPRDVSGPDGLILNWNNRSAPGFMHGDDEPYGSVHRVENFDKFPERVQITDNVGIMNRAATEDVRSSAWPVVSRVLRTAGPAPDPRDQEIVDLLDDWVADDAPRLDADNDTLYDEAGPVIMDAVWEPIATAVMSPVFGSLIGDLDNLRNLNGVEGASFVDKDLRTLLGEPVTGPFNLAYCGDGSLAACADSLWQAIHTAADAAAAQQVDSRPYRWRKAAATTGFIPGLLPNRFPSTNRPTFQQVLEFERNF